MATQQELAEQLTALGVQITKIGTETQGLQQAIKDLEAALANQANVSPELQAAFDDVKAKVQGVDDLVADATPPTQ